MNACATESKPNQTQAQSPAKPAAISVADVQRYLGVLFPHGETFYLGSPSNDGWEKPGGIFNDTAKAAKAALEIEQCYQPPAIYTTANPCFDAIRARSNNKLDRRLKETVNDVDIEKRKLLFIDGDAVRASGVSSTDIELQHATDLVIHIKEALTAEGWPEPLVGMSGNGAYLLYRIDLPNNDASTKLVKDVLAGLHSWFSTGQAKVDQSNCNAARLIKVLGTWARKGDQLLDVAQTEQRPHRKSHVVSWPKDDTLVEVSRELLEAVCVEVESPATTTTETHYAGSERRLDLARYLRGRGVEVKRVKPLPDGRDAHILEHCVFNHEHGANGESAFYISQNGKLGYQCMHDSCQGLGWTEARRKVGEPDISDWIDNAPVLPGIERVAARLLEDELEPAITGSMSVEDALQFSEFEDAVSIPEEFLNPPGLLSDIIRHINRQSFRKQPEFALAAALSIVSAIIGHKVRAEDGGGVPNLYMLLVGGTGSGKEVGREIAAATLQQTHVKLQPEPRSGSAFAKGLKRSPVSLFQIDEIQDLISRAVNKNQAHALEIFTHAKSCFSAGTRVLPLCGYANDDQNIEIAYPYPVIYLTGTKDVWKVVPDQFITGGIIGRSLMFEELPQKPRKRHPKAKDVPAKILNEIAAWGQVANYGNSGEFVGAKPPWIMVKRTPGAHQLFNEYGVRCDLQCESEVAEAIRQRAAELAERIAMVVCASRMGATDSLVVNEDDARYAIGLCEFLTERMIARCITATIPDDEKLLDEMRQAIANHFSKHKKWPTWSNIVRKLQTRVSGKWSIQKRKQCSEWLKQTGELAEVDGRLVLLKPIE